MAFTEGLADTDRGASWSHGEDAGRMGGVGQATELSQLLSTTAVLFRGLAADRLRGERLNRLSHAAKRLVLVLGEISEGQRKDPSELAVSPAGPFARVAGDVRGNGAGRPSYNPAIARGGCRQRKCRPGGALAECLAPRAGF